MTQRFKAFLAIAILAFFILGICAVAAIGKIQLHYDGGGYYGGNSVNEEYLAVRIAEEMARQEGKLFINTSEQILALDADTLQAEFLFTAIPKEYQEGSAAELFVGEQTVPMQWNNGILEAKALLPLGTLAGEEYRVTVKTGNTYRSEIVQAETSTYLYGAQSVFSPADLQWTFDDNTFRGTLTCKLDESLLPFGEKAKSARVYAEEKGKAIYEKPMRKGVLDETIQVKVTPGVPITIYAEVTGESGLVYRYFLLELRQEDYSFGVNYSPTDAAETVHVIAPNGKTMELGVYY